MNILGLDSSAVSASAAVFSDGKLLSSLSQNTGLTHSQTLLPLAQCAMQNAGLSIQKIDQIAVCSGPGSFTGVRIGVAAAKGLAFGSDIQCVSVSTLEAIAYRFLGIDCIVCAAMDARRAQVYTAVFRCLDSGVERLTDDNALAIIELEQLLKDYKLPVYFAGDGANLCYNGLKDKLPGARLAPPHLRYQHAESVAIAASMGAGTVLPAKQLVPVYLRPSQAERELKLKLK